MIRLPELPELLDEVVDFLVGHRDVTGVRNGPLHERVCPRFGEVLLRSRSVPQAHEHKLRIETLYIELDGVRVLCVWQVDGPGRPRAAPSQSLSIVPRAAWLYQRHLVFHFVAGRDDPGAQGCSLGTSVEVTSHNICEGGAYWQSTRSPNRDQPGLDTITSLGVKCGRQPGSIAGRPGGLPGLLACVDRRTG